MDIPSPEEVTKALAQLTHAQVHELARLSKVAFTTLWKIRSGETKDPSIGRVRKFWPHMKAAAGFQPARRPADLTPSKAAVEAQHAQSTGERRQDANRREFDVGAPGLDLFGMGQGGSERRHNERRGDRRREQ